MKISILLFIIILIFSTNANSQNGRATISQINNGSTIEVSLYLKSTGSVSWNLGFASFVFSYNTVAMNNYIELEEGVWDNNSNPDYSDQLLVPYNNGNSLSVEIGLNSIPSIGTVVPSDSTLIATIRFDILDSSAAHNLRWNLDYCAVLDNNGNNVTGGIIFTDPFNGILPVELTGFSANSKKNDVLLMWSTYSETNNFGFDIERSQISREDSETLVWRTIGFAKGYGNSIENKNYNFADKNLSGGKYRYRLKQLDFNGNFEYFVLNNEVLISAPRSFELSQNYPNPFNPVTKISFDLPFDGNVSLKIFDVSGKEIRTLVNDFQTAGYYTLNFDASQLTSGVYFYKLSAVSDADTYLATKKMLLLK